MLPGTQNPMGPPPTTPGEVGAGPSTRGEVTLGPGLIDGGAPTIGAGPNVFWLPMLGIATLGGLPNVPPALPNDPGAELNPPGIEPGAELNPPVIGAGPTPGLAP